MENLCSTDTQELFQLTIARSFSHQEGGGPRKQSCGVCRRNVARREGVLCIHVRSHAEQVGISTKTWSLAPSNFETALDCCLAVTNHHESSLKSCDNPAVACWRDAFQVLCTLAMLCTCCLAVGESSYSFHSI